MTASETNPDYERWADYDSYAYVTVCDGPDGDDDFIAPWEPPPPGDVNIYSRDPEKFTRGHLINPRVGIRE